MNLPAESLIAHTVAQMNARLAERIPGEDVRQLRSGLLYTGNIQDAFPRRLLLDPRLSPLDKVAWMMIRLYAQQNQGAVFPTYDELQLQLASPGKGKASRETVSRVLLMLRLTGWLSLCKRVRDERGRVRGNVYAQHDEPLTCRDAEALDPHWLDTAAAACRSKNRTVSSAAWSVLAEIKADPQMRHRHSHITLMEQRLASAQTPLQLADRQREILSTQPSQRRSTETGLSQFTPGSDTELSPSQGTVAQGSETELSLESESYENDVGVREPNRYVRTFIQSENKKTYVTPQAKATLPVSLLEQLSAEDVTMLTQQLQALPGGAAAQVLAGLDTALAAGKVSNPVGWLLAVMKRAREGALFSPRQASGRADTPVAAATRPVPPQAPLRASSPDHVSRVVAEIRRSMAAGRAS
jgi:hypothetical protein